MSASSPNPMDQAIKRPATLLHGLFDAAVGLRLSEICAEQGVTLIVTADVQQADLLLRELNFFSADRLSAVLFPDWETLPYDMFSPHQDIISERLNALYQLPLMHKGAVVVPVTTLMQKMAPPDYILAHSLILNIGDRFDTQLIRNNLVRYGYNLVDTVYEHGEFAVRGSIIDIFPMGSARPYRIDLFDDEIEQLRSFDVENQRTVELIESVRVLPAREFPSDDSAIETFRINWRTAFEGDPKSSHIYQDVSKGFSPSGIESYLPLFFKNCGTLFDYLPNGSHIVTLPGVQEASERFWDEIRNRYEDRRYDLERPLLAPTQIYLPVDELNSHINGYAITRILHANTKDQPQSAKLNQRFQPPTQFNIDHHADSPFEPIKKFSMGHQGRILFCAESVGRKQMLEESLSALDLHLETAANWDEFIHSDAKLAITVAPLDRGLSIADGQLELICESQIFGAQVRQERRRSKSSDQSDQVIKSLAELNIGSAVVHLDHGVGRYLGLETLSIEGQSQEFLVLAYADEAKLYVPIAALHLIARYSGSDDEHTPLHRLGSDRWQKAKRKAAEQIRDTAAELLEIHAKRAAKQGLKFNVPQPDYQKFTADFPFEETPDQQSAIEDTLADMQRNQAMDRLICGDVGFGKTEVAMRAAFVATHNNYQVAILVPTTLLAQQHFESFQDRFANWPVTIDVISRFRSAAEQKEIEQQLANGKLDIVIGTHKLILGKMPFRNLGLLIIDEEHRFGVRQKEQIKALKSEVDILTLTATPIPRTLNMALSSMRDISIISSPPAKRLSIKTFVQRQDNSIRREAINRELMRGGQVYLLHNEVQSIERKADEIRKLLPEARVAVAHGQLRERELEKTMSDFYHKRFNVLICSTIIETGIDIPSANTIIIERADKFGLAQLHQLRGRVGRSHHQAYAFLLIPDTRSITSDARKRLDAITEAQDLGAGFMLATYDLEIRGAGELLGDNQSGHIHSIGYTLYTDLLAETVASLRKGETLNLEDIGQRTEIKLHLPALIPDTYLPDVHTRLVFYKRIANAVSDAQLRELQVEMIDRFGLLTDSIRTLFTTTSIKLKAEALGIAKIDVNASRGKIEFETSTKVDATYLIQLIQQQPDRFKLSGANQLQFVAAMENSSDRISKTQLILDQLAAQG